MASNQSDQKGVRAQTALQHLKEGNTRFAGGQSAGHNLLQQMAATKDGQTPFAAIVSCMDSRTSVELVFDLGIGHVFSIRNAGNVVTDAALGSLEYAVAAVNVKLIVVMGHTGCGAVKGACDNVELGHLTALLQEVNPAKEAAKDVPGEHSSKNTAYVQKVTHEHAVQGVRRIMEKSDVIREQVEKGEVGIVPAVYDIATGRVTFMEDQAVMEGAAA